MCSRSSSLSTAVAIGKRESGIELAGDLPASPHHSPQRSISSESHINGSRTHGVADAPQTVDHYASIARNAYCPRNDDR